MNLAESRGGGRKYTLAIFAIIFLLFASPAQAALYAPGETLDPACAPTDLNCGVQTVVGTGTTGQVPYYAANGGVLTATSTVTILSSGRVGVGTTTPWGQFSIAGVSGASTPLFTISTSTASFATSTALYVNSNGLVGIGTSSPRAPLEVNGHAVIDGGYIVINNNPSIANFFIGNDDGYDITSGAGNFGMGLHALQLLQDGINNTAIGWDSQMFNVTGDNNTSVGEDALKNVVGNGNTAFGYTSGYSVTSGTQNTSMSPLSLYNVTTGSYNVALGHNAGNGLQTNSSANVLVGYGTYNSTATANNNTAIGYGAGYYSTGSSNVFLGYSAGLNETNSNRLYIDNKGGSASTALIYGVFDSSINNQSVTVNGNFGIATTSPVSRLALDADSATTGITLTDFSVSGPNKVIDAYTPNSTLGGYFITNPNTYSAHFGLNGNTAQIGSTNATPVQLVTSGVARIYLDTTGNVGIASTTPWRKFSVNGTVALNGLTSSATGNAVCITTTKDITDAGGASCVPSSIRFKENVETLPQDFAVNELGKLRVVSFDYKPGFYSPEDSLGSYGLIAEEVEQIDPKLVDYGYDGQPLTLKFEKLTGLAIQAIQELSQKVSGFAESITTVVLNATTGNFSKKICVGSTCLTESQLQKLLQDSGQQSDIISNPSPETGGGAEVPDTTSTDDSITPEIPQPEEPVEETPAPTETPPTESVPDAPAPDAP